MKEIGYVTRILMISTALFFDLLLGILGQIPILGSALAILPLLTFALWFKLHGMKFTSPKKLLTLPVATIIEAVPILNILPGWTVAVLVMLNADKLKKITGLGATDGKVMGHIGPRRDDTD